MTLISNLAMSAYIGGLFFIEAYRNTHRKLLPPGCSSSRALMNGIGDNLVENSAIREEFRPFLKRTGIREDVFFGEQIVTEVEGGFDGTNAIQRGSASVHLCRNMFLWDPNACRGVIKHELGHIKHNDGLRIPLVSAVTTIASTFFGFSIASAIGGVVPALSIGTASLLLPIAFSRKIYVRFRESRADEFAIRESSIDELKGLRRFLVVAQKIKEMQRKKDSFFLKIWHYDWTHPSIVSRIDRINQELQKRHVRIDASDELAKEDRLVEFLYLTATHQPTDTVREIPHHSMDFKYTHIN
jgi:hypothetical protein